MTVEVVFAAPESQILRRLEMPAGSTAAEAIAASGLAGALAGKRRVGIHGRVVAATTVLKNGDRVEIYRPLRADPKELRRARAGKRARG